MPEVPLVMPKLSMTMAEGEVIGWRKRAGDAVSAGEVVCEVLTDKVDMEVEAPVAGVLDRIVAEPNATVPVGQPLAFIRTDADALLAGLLDTPAPAGPAAGTETAGAAAGAAPAAPSPELSLEPAPGPAPEPAVEPALEPAAAGAPGPGAAAGAGTRPTPPSRQGPKPALPGARRRAGELGVRLDRIAGTGPSGAVTLADVEQAAGAARPADGVAGAPPGSAQSPPRPALPQPVAATPSAPAPQATAPPETAPPEAAAPGTASPDRTPAPSGVDPGFAAALTARRRSVRAAVARAMTASAAVPQFTLFAELDLAALDRERAGIGWTTLLVRAFATALRAHPELNATWSQAGPQDQPDIGIAVATDTPVGLLAPVLRNPDRCPLTELDGALRRLVGRARAGRLGAEELAGATATVSNLGGFAVAAFQALLTPPQASVLSVGRIGPRPVALPGGGLVARLGCTVGLTVDHRVADGADAGRLLGELTDLLGAPARLLGGAR